MAHFAEIQPTTNVNLFTVTNVIVAEQDFIDTGLVGPASSWIQTSYNSRGGVHYDQNGQPDNIPALRANYASVGDTYDKNNDVFYKPQPHPSWTICAPDWIWKAPIPHPTDGKYYIWNEDNQSWTEPT